MHRIAIFGGTFDPIHNGHLQTSINIQNQFQFDSYRFLPCKIPVIKPPGLASNQQRIQMLELAIKNHQEFSLDLREIERDSPSYMVDTLTSFRLEYPSASITLIIGYDAFLSLPHWHQWEKIITLANLLVISRTEFSQETVPEIIQTFLNHYETKNKTALLENRSGTLYLFDAGNYDISSTRIREEIRQKKFIKNKLPPEIYRYITAEGLYQ